MPELISSTFSFSTIQEKNLKIWLSLKSHDDDGLKKLFCRALMLGIPIEECIKIRGRSATKEKSIILKKMMDEKTGSCVK